MKKFHASMSGIGLALAAAMAIPGQAQATPQPEIRAYGGEGAYGGSVGASHPADDWNPNAKAGDQVGFTLTEVGGDLSYADANALATFGQLHAYADAHRTYNSTLYGTPYGLGDAQATAETLFVDYILPSASSPIGYSSFMLTLGIAGSHSATAGGPAGPDIATGWVHWDIRDNSTGNVYANGSWNSTDLAPSALLSIPVVGAVNGDLMRLEVDLSASAYVMSDWPDAYRTGVADYSHTVNVNFDAVTSSGGNTVGVSGYDYASAVPEPSTCALLLAGLGILTVRGRRRVS
jgi:hypothetical protein